MTITQLKNNQNLGWITQGFLGICIALFVISHFLLPAIKHSNISSTPLLFTSPIEKTLLYDYPKFYEYINQMIRLYGPEGFEHPENLPPEGKALVKKINTTPYWPGYYQLILKGNWSDLKEGLEKYPSFEKIREGQMWRFFTPCLLHGDVFHILFNMLWLISLGRQIEKKITPWRYILLILLIGIISNTAQYLMSGPNFIGFSGILVGMLAFIWVRQKKAPWEGYQIDRSTMLFMLIFILGMAAIQSFSFFLEKSFEWDFSPNIANMAHLTGGLVGYLLGKMNFFSWRHA